jgi:hypothetical protein
VTSKFLEELQRAAHVVEQQRQAGVAVDVDDMIGMLTEARQQLAQLADLIETAEANGRPEDRPAVEAARLMLERWGYHRRH